MSKYKLIMLRHGEGAWNKENRFCSWVDQKLNSEGMEEARNCGKQLKALNLEIDLVFTSVLNRSIHTAWLILEELGQEWVPVESSWRLNERHYGALIGLNREQMALNHGEEQVRLWRRSYNVTPPPIEESHPFYHEIYNDRRYKVCDVPVDQLPRSESLKDVLERLLPFWNERIAPEVLSGKTVLISAHGNSSRALLKHLEDHWGDFITFNLKVALNTFRRKKTSDRLRRYYIVSLMKTLSILLYPLESPFSWNWMRTCMLLGPTSSWVTKKLSKLPLRK
ncbi:bisphosphoglycerate mutase isoform X2 [Mustela erminea]|uniref:bisphosphoglycerate mutase isoform X2 n=1 Tax=Mustela erminea TaxID=36723 RepID=UPI001386B15D|nr:bisphosphoglycerate mutase isoform X2 [Mustela erminea]